MIIDAFILRDPGNYKDVIDILELENVITKEKHSRRLIKLSIFVNNLHMITQP